MRNMVVSGVRESVTNEHHDSSSSSSSSGSRMGRVLPSLGSRKGHKKRGNGAASVEVL